MKRILLAGAALMAAAFVTPALADSVNGASTNGKRCAATLRRRSWFQVAGPVRHSQGVSWSISLCG